MAIISKTFKSATDLKKDMLDTAMKVMEGFYSDIIYDLEKVDDLAKRKRDGHFYWAVRKTGTHTRSTNKELEELKQNWGESIVFTALVGRSIKEDTFEIVYQNNEEEK